MCNLNQAYLWIPAEQRFMIVGGRNPQKTTEVLRSAFFFSTVIADDVEELQ